MNEQSERESFWRDFSCLRVGGDAVNLAFPFVKWLKVDTDDETALRQSKVYEKLRDRVCAPISDNHV